MFDYDSVTKGLCSTTTVDFGSPPRESRGRQICDAPTKTRRDFLTLAATASLVGATRSPTEPAPASAPAPANLPSGSADRDYWRQIAKRLSTPVLEALAARRLKATMPVEAAPNVQDRPQYTYLETLGRLLCGIAPWLELGGDPSPEGRERARLADLARRVIDAGTEPASPDFMNFSQGRQPLVDAAFLVQAMLRAPTELWQKLEPRVRGNVIAALKSSRPIPPGETTGNSSPRPWRFSSTAPANRAPTPACSKAGANTRRGISATD